MPTCTQFKPSEINIVKLSQNFLINLRNSSFNKSSISDVLFIHSFLHEWLYSPLLGPRLFFSFVTFLTQMIGRAVPQTVSRWLPTVATRLRARVWSYGICGGQYGAGAGFLRGLRFPLPIFIPPIAPQSPSYIIWCWYNRPALAAVPSGLSLTPLRIILKTNTQTVGLLGLVISLSLDRYLHTGRHKHKHPCIEGELNPWSQRSRKRIQFMA
jgi:hypothetical protein